MGVLDWRRWLGALAAAVEKAAAVRPEGLSRCWLCGGRPLVDAGGGVVGADVEAAVCDEEEAAGEDEEAAADEAPCSDEKGEANTRRNM